MTISASASAYQVMAYWRWSFGSSVRVRVLDLAGRLVAKLQDGPVTSERQTLTWDGTRNGARVPPGIYYVEVRGPLRTSRIRVAKLQ